MKKVRIPWQENSPLHTPRGVYEFQDGIGYVDDETCQRLLAIYGDKIEVLEELEDDKNNTEESSQDNARPSVSGKGNKESNKKSRRKVSQDDT